MRRARKGREDHRMMLLPVWMAVHAGEDDTHLAVRVIRDEVGAAAPA